MKKIVLILIFIIQITPVQQRDGNIEITAGISLYAQCAGPDAGSPCGSSGGAFWQWLNTAFVNIGNFFTSIGHAVSNFVHNVPGGNTQMPEGMTDENQNWSWTDNGWLPNDGNDPGGPYDPWADSYWQSLGLSPDEMNILQNWQYYYDVYQQGGNPPPPPPGRYYVKVVLDVAGSDTINGATPDTTKYYEGDTIYLMQQTKPATLVIYRENGTVSTTDLAWKRNDTSKCGGIISCEYNISNVGIIQEKVDSANSKLLTKNPIKVYKKPIVYFRIGTNYNGEYGFDDSSQTHPTIRNNIRYKAGTEMRKIETDTAYVVPWMGLLDKQGATIKLEKKWITHAAGKDKNFEVIFKQSSSKIKLNGSASTLKLNYQQLISLDTINIHAEQWESNYDNLKTIGSIHVLTKMGDTIGKLNLSCGKQIKKKIVLVYVNTGTGFRNDINRNTIIHYLNNNSQNQIFRKWVIDSANSVNGMDTLDLKNEFLANNAAFMDEDSLIHPRNMETFYRNHKGVDILYGVNQNPGTANSNDSAKVHYVFIMNYQLPFINGGVTLGVTTPGGYKSIIWANGNLQTIAHEMGHILKLRHVFGVNSFLIPQGTTKNFMDYAPPGGPDLTEMFYFAQWVDTY
jgi:hypothetical protein